jgi:hypothetical protein
MTSLDDVRWAAAAYHHKKRERDEALAELQRTLRAARDSGVPPKDLVAAAGVGRQTVFDALKGKTATVKEP